MEWKRGTRSSTAFWWPNPDIETIELDGEVVGFCWASVDWHSTRESLPPELFNHEMRKLDADDPRAVAEFMGEYGILFAPWSRYAEEMTAFNLFIDDGIVGTKPRTKRQIRDKLRELGDDDGVAEWRLETRKLWAAELKRKMESDFDDYEPRLFIVSYAEVRVCLLMVENYVTITSALHDFDGTEDDLARRLDIDDVGEAVSIVTYYDNMINDMLGAHHPDVFMMTDDGIDFAAGGYMHVREKLGDRSLMHAVALQLYELNANLDKARHCRECGRLFLTRRTKGKTSARSQSSSVFCCDACRNRHAQRKHRESMRATRDDVPKGHDKHA